MGRLIALVSGLGLLASGMTDPARVKGFLDGAGAWDPSLALVTGGLLFGIGWGIAGFCPGPALVAVASGSGPAALFVVAMLAGMLLHDHVWARGQRTVAPA